MLSVSALFAYTFTNYTMLQIRGGVEVNRPTAEKANFESLIGLVFNLLSVKVFDKNRKI